MQANDLTCLACGCPLLAASDQTPFPNLCGTDNAHRAVRLPVLTTIVAVSSHEAPLVFACDEVAGPFPPTSAPMDSLRAITTFPSVIAVTGSEIRLAVGPQLRKGDDEERVPVACGPACNGDNSNRERCGGGIPEKVWKAKNWAHCFSLSCDAISEMPKAAVHENTPCLHISLPLLTLLLRVPECSVGTSGETLATLAAAISKAKSTSTLHTSANIRDNVEGKSKVSTKTDDQVHEDRQLSGAQLPAALEEFVRSCVSLVMPPIDLDGADLFPTVASMSWFAESAAGADRALKNALSTAERWTQFATSRPSSGSAGEALTAEQLRERRISSRALHPAK